MSDGAACWEQMLVEGVLDEGMLDEGCWMKNIERHKGMLDEGMLDDTRNVG